MAEFIIYLPLIVCGLFVVAVGACVGSLINVIVYRLPLGMSIMRPPSRCPSCETRLTWRENIPVLGWVLLGGKCRFCKSRVSVEYPLVEALTAAVFGLAFCWLYVIPISWGVTPEWALNDRFNAWPRHTWPAALVVLTLLGGLIAMTITDLKSYTIPLEVAWFVTAVALVVHPLHAAWFQIAHGPVVRILDAAETQLITAEGFGWLCASPTEPWTLATGGLGGWGFIGMGLGGVVGLGVSGLLLRLKLIRRSFMDYDEWEAKALAEAKAELQREAEARGETLELDKDGNPLDAEGNPTDLWIAYPHARREMVKEMAFLATPFAGMVFGAGFFPSIAAAVVGRLEDGSLPAAPMWLVALGGVLAGYLIGGGVVWGVRVLGSLAFNKEAMGLGDVHLLAAVGACLGWIDATVALFAGAFVGLALYPVTSILMRSSNRTLPFGPSLAIAAALVFFAKPALEWGLGQILGQPIDLP